jgi:hypothetical protein
MRIVELEKDFVHEGYRYIELDRKDGLAIYRRTKDGSTFSFYDVCILQKEPVHDTPDTFREVLPDVRQWGTCLFFFHELSFAREKFNNLLNHVNPTSPQ